MKKKQITVHSVHFYDAAPEVAESEVISAPAFIQLLPPSGFTGRDGRGPFTYSFETLAAAFNANGADLPIDKDHQIYSAGQGLDGKAYAWIKGIAQYDDGSVWGSVEWTAEGRYLVESKAYRYISPAFDFLPTKSGAVSGEITKLVGGSIVNLPNLVMTSLNAQETVTTEAGTENPAEASGEPSAASIETDAPVSTPEADEAATDAVIEPVAETTEPATADTLATAIAGLLELAQDYDDEAIVEAIKTLVAAKTDAESQLAAHSAQVETITSTYSATAAETHAQVTSLQSQVQSLTAELNAVKQAQHEEKVLAAVDAAISGGKFVPALRENLLTFARADLKNFESFVATAPIHQAMSAVTIRNADSETNTFGLTDAELELCKNQKIKPETFAKNKQKHSIN